MVVLWHDHTLRTSVIVGIGIDVVDLQRFSETLERTPGIMERLFTASERTGSEQTLAATFAAKEALAKALGVPGELSWHDVEVTHDPTGRPILTVSHPSCADLSVHVSLTHDAGIAMAVVVAER